MSDIFQPLNISYSIKNSEFEPKDLEIRRTLEESGKIFKDQSAVNSILEKKNPTLIDVYMAPIPETPEHLMVLMTRIYPGKVGEEYFMTKGHIHESSTAPEVYITMRGRGKLLLQTPENETHVSNMNEGKINYIPSGWAHRAVNTGSDELVFLGIYPADSQRNYSFIGPEKKNFGKLVVEKNGEPVVIDNPEW